MSPEPGKDARHDAARDLLEKGVNDSTVTRRKQFQMKKNKSNKRKEAKEKKAEDKLQKKAEKDRKRKEKEESKAQNMLHKQKARKQTLQQQQQADEQAKQHKQARGRKRLHKDMVKNNDHKKNKKMRKLAKLKFASKQKAMLKNQQCKNQHTMRSTAGSEASPTDLKQQQQGTKGQKGKTQTRRAKSKSPCEEVVNLVKGVVAECNASNCTHPNWKLLSFDPKIYQLSVYWSRMSVGVKMANTNKKSKTKFSQVAYFGCSTTCVYTNMLLAYQFATW